MSESCAAGDPSRILERNFRSEALPKMSFHDDVEEARL